MSRSTLSNCICLGLPLNFKIIDPFIYLFFFFTKEEQIDQCKKRRTPAVIREFGHVKVQLLCLQPVIRGFLSWLCGVIGKSGGVTLPLAFNASFFPPSSLKMEYSE